jgi:hypothetical protein
MRANHSNCIVSLLYTLGEGLFPHRYLRGALNCKAANRKYDIHSYIADSKYLTHQFVTFC